VILYLSSTKLQELVQQTGKNEIVYRVINKEGFSHNPIFTVELLISSKSICIATGQSKKLAENECAKNAIEILNKNGKK
jgi:ribonuclease-3